MRLKGELFSNNLLSNSVGGFVGNKLSTEFEMMQQRRLFFELLEDKSNDGSLSRCITQLVNFQFIIDNLNHYYFSKIQNIQSDLDRYGSETTFDYEAYE